MNTDETAGFFGGIRVNALFSIRVHPWLPLNFANPPPARDSGLAAKWFSGAPALSLCGPAPVAPAPAGTAPSFPAGTANRHRTTASSATTWRSNQSGPGFAEVSGPRPAGRGEVASLWPAGR